MGVTFDASLNFNYHLENILKKASAKSSRFSKNYTLDEYPSKKTADGFLFYFLLYVWITSWWLGGAIAAQWITRLIGCIKGASALYTVQGIMFWKIIRKRWIYYHTY